MADWQDAGNVGPEWASAANPPAIKHPGASGQSHNSDVCLGEPRHNSAFFHGSLMYTLT